MERLPLISCLMVTPASETRWPFVQRSITDYCRQSHSAKELIIVLDNPSDPDKYRIEAYIQGLKRDDVRLVNESPKVSLGALRNSSIRNAQGPILCQWDDDDLHHPRRLELQVGELLRQDAGAIYLKNIPHLFPRTREVYWVNWGHTKMRGHPGTLMYRKDIGIQYPEEGEHSQRGEDSQVLYQLNKKTRVAFHDNPIGLYVYIFHGSNTFHFEHHRFLATRFAESREFMSAHRKDFDEALASANLGIDGLVVMDQQGVAWSWKRTEK
jgi:glycosyltransferase involved in cell wall biosynthesis